MDDLEDSDDLLATIVAVKMNTLGLFYHYYWNFDDSCYH